MQKRNSKLKAGRQLYAIVIVFVMLFSSFVGITLITKAEPLDIITAYRQVGENLEPTVEIGDEENLTINITVDDISGDPEGTFYTILVRNQNTSEWLNLNVSDNAPFPPTNVPDDGEYWGRFFINSSEPTHNSSGGEDPAILQVFDNNVINISEFPLGPLDGDAEIEIALVTANFAPPPPEYGTVQGSVETVGDEPVVDATVHLIGASDYFVNTDESGLFIFDQNVSADNYDTEVYKVGEGGFNPQPGEPITVEADQIAWLNFTVGMAILGQVQDRINETSLVEAPVMVYKQGPLEGYFDNGPYFTDEEGTFFVDASSAGAGSFSVEVYYDGYVGFINWTLDISEGETIDMGIIYLEPLFMTRGEDNATLQGKVTAEGEPIEGASLMLLDTNFNHMISQEGGEGEMGNSAVTDEEGNYNFEITYRSTYRLIAFYEGYYADLSGDIIITEGGQVEWKNFSLQEAEPDDLFLTFNFTDLDDATVTINRTIVAASRVFRFELDINPDTGGDSNQNVSNTEVASYLEMIDMMGLSFESLTGEDQGNEQEGKGSDFLSIPVNVLLDSSAFDAYVPASHSGAFENLVNTSIMSNVTIYYNATFDITLDGPILNQTTHTLNLTAISNNTVATNITFLFNPLYNITVVVNDSLQGYLFPGDDYLIAAPGLQEPEGLAYANVTLELNGSTVDLPVYEVPTWNIDDRWTFSETGEEQATTYTVKGKPVYEWDEGMYNIGEGGQSYICYEISRNDQETLYATIADLDWVNVTGKTIQYLVNDVDFPIYDGKTWLTTSWWNESVTATILAVDDVKITENGTFSCIKINYTNITDEVVGQEWYSPAIKFFVNRTRYIFGDIDTALDLANYSLSPFIESYTLTEYEDEGDGDLLINSLNVSIIINSSQYYDGPTNYRIEGPLKKYVNNGPSVHITYMWNDTALQNLERDGDGTEAILCYSGAIINASGVDGPYTIEVQMRKTGDGGPDYQVDLLEIETVEYSYTDFQSPAVTILALDDTGNDTNANGLYDYLTVNITLDILEDGNYSVQGGLNYLDGWEPRWITGTGTESMELSAGESPTIQLNFDGTDIYEQGHDSPYRLNIEVWNDDTHLLVIQNESDAQGIYVATVDFERPSIYFNRTWMAESGEHDYINGSSYLTINISIFVAEGKFSGGTEDYDLHSGLENNTGCFMTGTGGTITLSEGENIIPVNFNIGDIYERNPIYNGTYTMHLGFKSVGEMYSPDIDNSMYETQQYDLTDPTSFPPPPITIELVSDEPSGDGNYLTVQGWVNITSETYVGVELDLHGGVHWIEHMEGWDNWHFITGMGDTVSYPETGNYTISINFSGLEIAGSGQNGPYNIWMGIETIPEHERVADVEYDTGAWSPDDFAQPGVEFVDENTSDFINGTDFLTLETSVTVATAGTYQIGGGIHLIQHMMGYDNWVFITGTGNQYTLTQNTNLSFNFDQGMIRTAMEAYDYSGELMVSLSIQNITSWQQVDRLEYNTQPYEASDFSAAAIVINSATPSISNGDLVVNINYTATRSDTYRINGGLHNQNWYFITGTQMETTVTVGNHSVNLTYDGGQIYNSGIDGPYRLWIGFENRSTHQWVANIEALTPAWNYSDFSAPEVRFMRDDMASGEADYLNGTFLTINVNINATAPGTYRLDGGLNYVENNNWQWITGAGRDVILSEGDNIIPLNFNAGDIQASGRDGPYCVWLAVRDITTWLDIDHYEYTTQTYTADDFPAPSIVFGEMIEGDPTYGYINGSYFSVNVTLEVNGTEYEGTYDLHGGVAYQPEGQGWWQHLTGGGRRVDLENGTSIITLNFNAGEIQNGLPEGYDDNLSVYIGLSNISTWMEISHIEYITAEFSQGVFPPPAVIITTTGDYVNTSGGSEYYTLNLTVTLNETTGVAGEYDVNGGIHWIDDSSGWEQWRFITGTGGPRNLVIGDNEIALNFNAGDIYNTLSENEYNDPLVAWIGVNDRTTWENLAHDEYRSPDDYSIDDFSAPSLIINCTGDYNNASEFLTVNLTIGATGTSLDQTYDIHAGLHWQDNWQWEWITGYGTSLNVTEESVTIPLNFNGGAIRSAGHNGTYEIWVGISEQGSWQDITHDQYTTGYYTYDEFAPPAVEILDDQITDYANDSTYLTFNVTVNANETGDYFIESCLHWRDGYQWNWIAWAGRQVTISEEGVQNITLNFDGFQIAQAAENGWSGGTTLVAWISIRNATTWAEIHRIDEYTTNHSYNVSDFMEAPVTFNRSTPIVYTESNGDLIAAVPFNNTHAQGNYTIQAALFTSNNKTFVTATSGWIRYSNDSVNLTFDGQKIYKKNYNGTYEFRAKIFDNVTHYEYDRIINITDSFTYDQFTPSTIEARIIGSYTNVTISNYIVVNVTINITSAGIGEDFKVYADLFNETNARYITSNSTIISTAPFENVTATLNFNRTAINATGESLPYLLTYVRLSILNEEGVWEELEVKTPNYIVTGGE